MNFAEAETYLFSLGNAVETMKLAGEYQHASGGAGRPKGSTKSAGAGTTVKVVFAILIRSVWAGIRTGFYFASSYLDQERIKIDGSDVSENALQTRFAGTELPKACRRRALT